MSPDNRVPKRVSTRQPCPQEGFLGCVNAWREASDNTEKNAESQGHSCALMGYKLLCSWAESADMGPAWDYATQRFEIANKDP